MHVKIIVSTALVFSLAACAGAPANAPTSTPASTTAAEAVAAALAAIQTVTVTMNDYNFVFTPSQVTAGVVKFVVHNASGALIHEFFLVKTDLPADQLPLSADGLTVNEDATQFTKLGSVEDVDPGKGGEMTVRLDPGHYVYFCNTTAHYHLGMAGEITVPAQGAVAFTTNSNSVGVAASMPMSVSEVVTVSMTNFAFQFTPPTIKAGMVTFVVQNSSADLMHEFFLVKTDLPVAKLPLNADGTSINEDSPQLTKVGAVEDVDASKGGVMTVMLVPGRYVYFCNKQGHYQLGMAGEFTVVS